MLDIEIMPDVSRLKEKIHEMLPNEKDIKVTASHDAIVLAGTVSNTSNLSQVVALANAYAPQDKDKKGKVMNLLEVGGVHQVMLEVRVSEMSRTLHAAAGCQFCLCQRRRQYLRGISPQEPHKCWLRCLLVLDQ